LKEAKMNDQLRYAMHATDLAEMDALAEEIGATAVRTALAVQAPDERRLEEEARQKAEAEAQRQRDRDAALADAIEAVARHRARLGRKTCSQHDASATRQIFELLRGLTPGMDE
jgi:hypothetical protein